MAVFLFLFSAQNGWIVFAHRESLAFLQEGAKRGAGADFEVSASRGLIYKIKFITGASPMYPLGGVHEQQKGQEYREFCGNNESNEVRFYGII